MILHQTKILQRYGSMFINGNGDTTIAANGAHALKELEENTEFALGGGTLFTYS